MADRKQRILFLQSLTYPFIGVMSLSAVLRKAGHETQLFILDMKHPTQRDFDRIRELNPDVVGFPVYTGWQVGVLSFCRMLKDKMDVLVVLGGRIQPIAQRLFETTRWTLYA